MGGFGITPTSDPFRDAELTEDESAFVYYGTWGLLDPKMPAEAFAFGGGSLIDDVGWAFVAPSAAGFVRGGVYSMAIAFVVTGAVGWFLDPKHKRSGGVDEWNMETPSYVPLELSGYPRVF